MRIPTRRTLSSVIGCALGGSMMFLSAAARAEIPADYKGMPFDPATAGGVGIIPATVKAGPYPIPGRLDFVNYDLGGEQVAFHAGDHITTKSGAGYRKDTPPVATFSKTSMASMDVFYDSGTAMDGMPYPNATSNDFYIGAVQVNDWFNFTVNVQTAGTYTVSSTWSSGNGPPGGEGGDGAMGLQVFSNGTKLADWKASFPDFANKANFHYWKPYPSFATVTLAAGPQVIKLQSTSKHLNLDYVQFDLMGADGGTSTGAGGAGGAGTGGAAGASGSGGATGAAGATTGAAGGSGAAGTGGSGTMTGAAGDGSTAGSAGGGTTTGTAGAGAAGTGGPATGAAGTGAPTNAPPKEKSGGGCSYAGATSRGGALGVGVSLVALALIRRRRRR
jgi:hypothetical protein